MSNTTASQPTDFVDRRTNQGDFTPAIERRQFSNSYDNLDPEVRELALAIDQYKLHHRRRFISYEEIYNVMRELGYRKD